MSRDEESYLRMAQLIEDKLAGRIPAFGDQAAGFNQVHPVQSPGGSIIDSKMLTDLGNIIKSTTANNTGGKKLDPAPTRGGFPEMRNEAKAQGVTRVGGGIASPLTEGTTASPTTVQRTYYASETVGSSDGCIVFEIMQLKSISYVDSANNQVDVNFSQET